MMPMVAGVAPASRTICSSDNAVVTPSGCGRPCVTQRRFERNDRRPDGEGVRDLVAELVLILHCLSSTAVPLAQAALGIRTSGRQQRLRSPAFDGEACRDDRALQAGIHRKPFEVRQDQPDGKSIPRAGVIQDVVRELPRSESACHARRTGFPLLRRA